MAKKCCGFVKQHKLQGIEKNRSCTDIIFLLLFIASYVAAVVIFIEAGNNGGDPDKIVRGVDYHGRICGKSAGVEAFPMAVWPSIAMYKYMECKSSCEATEQLPVSLAHPDQFYKYSSTRFLHFCFPWYDDTSATIVNETTSTAQTSLLEDNFDSASEMIGRAAGDLYTAWPMFIVCAIVALLFTFLYTWATRYIAGVLVWACIALIIMGGSFLGIVLIKEANNAENDVVPNRQKGMRVMGWLFVALTFVFFLIVVFLRKRIRIAVEVIKMAAGAIGDIKSLVFFPIVPVFLAIIYFLFWVAEALYIFSVTDEAVGNIDPLYVDGFKEAYPNRDTAFVDLEFRDSFRGYALYHIFHLFWNVQFLFYFGYLVCAGAIADWYFTKCDASGNKIVGFQQDELSHMPVMGSFLRVLRYHMGTVAITSLIIAIIQTIRAVVKYIEEKVRGPEPNYVQKAVFCCIQCCLKCAECCMDKINKNALIWTAIWGDGFCVSACSSFALIWRNLARVAALHMVSSFIFFMGKVTVSLAVTGCFAWLFVSVDKYETELSSPVLPICIVFAIAYTISTLFMLVFESAADTIFFCFLVDEEKNKAAGSSMFASQELQELVGKHQGASEAASAKKKRFESDQNARVPLNAIAPQLGN